MAFDINAFLTENEVGVAEEEPQSVTQSAAPAKQTGFDINAFLQENAVSATPTRIAAEESDQPFFALEDAVSAIGTIPEALSVGVPAAFQKLVTGTAMPEESEAMEKDIAFQERMRQEQQDRQAAGKSSMVGEAIREAAPSIATSFGGLGAGIAGAVGGTVVGGPVGATVGGMAASGTASYRMAAADLLYRSFKALEEQKGSPLTEDEKAQAYKEFLPLAQNSALWEAGPEAVSNAVLLGAGKFVFGFGKPLARKLVGESIERVNKGIASKVAAGTGAVAAELGTETITALGQFAPEMAAQKYVITGTTEGAPTEYPGGAMQAFKDVAPATLALTGMMAGAGGVAKAATLPFQKAKTPEQIAEDNINLDADREADNLLIPDNDTESKSIKSQIDTERSDLAIKKELYNTLPDGDKTKAVLATEIKEYEGRITELDNTLRQRLGLSLPITTAEQQQIELAKQIAAPAKKEAKPVTPAPTTPSALSTEVQAGIRSGVASLDSDMRELYADQLTRKLEKKGSLTWQDVPQDLNAAMDTASFSALKTALETNPQEAISIISGKPTVPATEITPVTPAPPIAEATAITPAPVEESEFAELRNLMERRGQAQSKVKGVKFSKKDEARYNELLPKYRSRLFETITPEADPVVWKDIEGNDIKVSQKGTFYTVENGRVRTGPAFQSEGFVGDVSPQPVSASVVESNNVPLPEGYTKQGDVYVYQAPVAETPAVTEAPAAEVAQDIEAGAPPLSTENLYFENNLAQRAWRIAAGFKYDKERGDWFHPSYPELSRGNAEQEITDTNPPTKAQVRSVLDQLRQKYTFGSEKDASVETPTFEKGDMVRVPNRVPVYEKGEIAGGKTVMVGGFVTRIMPDGKVEVRLQQGGYATLPPAEIEMRKKASATPAVSEAPAAEPAGISRKRKGEAGGVLIPSREDFIQAGQNIYEAGMEFGAWANQMIQRFGDAVRQFLADVWEAVSGFPAKLEEMAGYLPGKGERGAVTFGRGEEPKNMDAEYLAAVERGDMETAQRMVDEAAKRIGIDIREIRDAAGYMKSYADDARESGNYDASENASYDAFERATKAGLSDIATQQMLSDVSTGLELETAFRDAIATTQIKSADPVTYDDAGNVIPLSQRFQKTSPDIRRMAAAQPVPEKPITDPATPDEQTQQLVQQAQEQENLVDAAVKEAGTTVFDVFNRLVNEGKTEDQVAKELGISNYDVRKYKLRADTAILNKMKQRKVKPLAFAPKNPVAEFAEKNLRKYFTKEGWLPKAVFQSWVKRNAALSREQKEAEFAIKDLYAGIREVFGISKMEMIAKGLVSVPPEFVQQLNDALAGKIDINTMPEPVREPLTRMRQHIDAMSRQLVDLNVLPDELAAKISANLGVYLTRSYKIFTDKNWINKIPTEKLTAARNFLYQQQLKNDPEATIEMADRELRNMLNDWASDAEGLRKRGGKLGAKDLSVMMERAKVPKVLREVMGENTNVIFNYANTIGKISRFVSDQKFLNEVKAKGTGEFLFTEKDAPKGFNTQIAAEESRTMSPLNGLRTTPEIAKAFEEFGKGYDIRENPGLRLLAWMNAVGKLNLTVGSVLTQMRNMLGQPAFFVFNGHYNWRVIRQEIDAIAKEKGISQEDAKRELVKLAAAQGLVNENAYAGELRTAFQEVGLETFDDIGPDEFTKQFVLTRMYLKGVKSAQELYQKTDEFGKLVGWLNETKRIQRMNKGMDKQTAQSIAAERTRDTYPTYSQSSEALRLFRRQPFVGPFATFFYETFRTSFHNLRYAFEDINGPTPEHKAEGIKRLAGAMTTLSMGAFGINLISKLASGIGDDEEEDVRRMLPPWAQDASLAWMPKSKDGTYNFINVSYINPYNAMTDPFIAMMSGFAKGDKPEEIAVQALGSFLSPFTSEQPVTATIGDAARNRTSTGKQIYNPQDDITTKTSKIMLHIFGKTFTPGTINRLRERIIPAIQGETVGTRAPAPAKEIAAELTGIRFETLDMKAAFSNKAWEFSRAANESERIFRDVATRRRRVDEQEQVDAYRRSEQTRYEIWNDMYRDYMAVRRAGASQGEAVRLMTDIGISKKEAIAISKGRYVPYEVSNEVLRRSKLNENKVPIKEIRVIGKEMPRVLTDIKKTP